MKDASQRDKFIDLRAKGWSYQKIADEIGVSKQTLINWSKQYQIEINNLKAIEHDALQTKFCMATSARIELLGGLLQRVREELDTRDLSQLSAEKLFDMTLKLCNALGGHLLQIKFTQERDEFPLESCSELILRRTTEEWSA